MLKLTILAIACALCACAAEPVKRADDVLTQLRAHDQRLQKLEAVLLQKLNTLELSLAMANAKLKMVCPSGYDAVKDSCYKLITSKSQWADAQRRCRMDGAHLVAIETAEEMNFIKSFLQEKAVGDTTTVWTGGHRNADGNFVWDGTNQPFTYTYWDNGDPGSERCVFMHYKRFGYKWNDGSCTYGVRPFICEM